MEVTAHRFSQIPNEVLSLIFKYLPVAPERWHCLFVNRAFFKAMQSHFLWTHITMQDSSLVDNSAAFGAKWQHVRKKSRFLGCLNPPKRLCFSIVQFLGYLKRCHQAYVVELDLSFVRLVNQAQHVAEKYGLKVGTTSTFWDLMFDFPNLRNLSLFGATIEENDVFRLPDRAVLCSSVRNLNLVSGFQLLSEDFRNLMQCVPHLETLQLREQRTDELPSSLSTNLKKLRINEDMEISENYIRCFPNLELLIGHDYMSDSIHKQGKTLVVPPKPLQNVKENDIKNFANEVQFIGRSLKEGMPMLVELMDSISVGHLSMLFKYFAFDINAKVRGSADIVFDPFELPYPNHKWFYGKPPVEGDTALHFALKSRKYELVQFLLQRGADLNIRDSLQRTPVFYVHDMRTLKLLVKYGADTTLLDINGWNILMSYIARKLSPHGAFEEDFEHVQTFFAMEDDYEDIEFKDINDYVALGCDIDYRTNDGLTLFKIALAAGNFFLAKHLLNISKKPLEETSPCVGVLSCVVLAEKHVAVHEQIEMINFLLEKGADPLIVDDAGQSFLHHAAIKNYDILMTVMNTKNPVQLINLKDNAGYSCVHYAVLPDEKVSFAMSDEQFEYISACKSSKPPSRSQVGTVTLRELVKKMAELDCVNIQATSGETPLLLSCRVVAQDRKIVIQMLLDHGADTNLVDNDGVSPLIAAAYELDYDSVAILLNYGADVNHCDKKGISPLLAATLRFLKANLDLCIKYERVLGLLLRHKADIDQKEKLCGMSALHLITMNISYPDLVFSGITKLVEHGADVNAKTHINDTPLHCAILNRNYNAFKALLELGADFNARGFGLMTPLHYILKYRDFDFVQNHGKAKDGFKAVGCAVVRYSAWNWSSVDDFTQLCDQNYDDDSGTIILRFFHELIKQCSSRIDFDARTFEGEVPLHCAMADFCMPLERFLIPNVLLEHATKQQLLLKDICGRTPLDNILTELLDEPKSTQANQMVVKCFEMAEEYLTMDHLILAARLGINVSKFLRTGDKLPILLPEPENLAPQRSEPPLFHRLSLPLFLQVSPCEFSLDANMKLQWSGKDSRIGVILLFGNFKWRQRKRQYCTVYCNGGETTTARRCYSIACILTWEKTEYYASLLTSERIRTRKIF